MPPLNQEERELTYGEKAVGLTFNVNNDPGVHKLKSLYAAIVDHLNLERAAVTSSESARLLSIAITEAQTAQMWAVKAITYKY